ncbi:CBS domain-containing protein CBSCBSPB3-like [Zingiber officinale]|uniref:Uncharacterized protein n=1 Tax=Zingiber officinale TaxID=94328 RepID=A0A8J5G878_ZINOF|nr:CBS domain-containing protein CBSCBSPB3-like [Zingiber officinale]KAG6493750.1 hypothetical protein ZIOFF_048752 [Zingiber officinale]
MATHVMPPASRRDYLASHRVIPVENGSDAATPIGSSSDPTTSNGSSRAVAVKKLRLSKSLILSQETTVYDACRRMASRKLDAVLLADAEGFLSGIVTAMDVVTKIVAVGLCPEQTIITKIMTRSPVFVMADTLASEALQMMVQGKFRHLPVVENGEVTAMLNINKCLYDAISRLERTVEQGYAIAAAIEGFDSQRQGKFSAPFSFTEVLQERMFKPFLSTIISENTKAVVVSPSDSVYIAAKKMLEFQVRSVIVANANRPRGILTSKDVLRRVVAQHLSPELILVKKVMTVNPFCATLEMTVLEALHVIRDQNFSHLPVIDREGLVLACLDVVHLTRAAGLMVEENAGVFNGMANIVTQKSSDYSPHVEPGHEEYDTRSGLSSSITSEGAETEMLYPPPPIGNSIVFKLTDKKGRIHRFCCGTKTLFELVSAVGQRIAIDGEKCKIKLLYEDSEGDKVLLATDDDLVEAMNHAKSIGWKVLRLHIDDLETNKAATSSTSGLALIKRNEWKSTRAGILVGTLAAASIGVLVYLKRHKV